MYFIYRYNLLKLLQKHGKIEKFDMLFHRSGPLAGQPRGYAFVSYTSKETAEKVRELLDGKKIGCKHIAVRWAHSMTKVNFAFLFLIMLILLCVIKSTK